MVLPAASGRFADLDRRRLSQRPRKCRRECPRLRAQPAREVSIAVALLILTISSIHGAIENVGNEARADALDLVVREWLAARQPPGLSSGLDRDHPQRRLARLEHLSDPGDGCRRCRRRRRSSRMLPPGGSFQISSAVVRAVNFRIGEGYLKTALRA